jgi:Heparinase II/III-like protein
MAELALRLGPRAVGRILLHRAGLRLGLAGRRLRDRPLPAGPFLVGGAAAPPPPALPAEHRAALLAAARGLGLPDWHGAFPPGVPALALDLRGPGDIRPVWERNRWAELPLLAQAARLDPAGGHLARAEAWLAEWLARNPPYRGPNWACGQEAALRALHLGLALRLLGGTPSPGARAIFALHGRRIAATPLYALAQDNNHPISEAAGLWLCGALAGEAGWRRRGRARLAAALRRLVGPDGGFAQLSTGYHRLLLDVLSIALWLGLPLPPAARARAAAAVAWLRPLVAPGTGAMPWLGHQDGSCFADLGRGGIADARSSLERAARLLAGGSAGWPAEPGCAWLALPPVPPLPAASPPAGQAGLRGWAAGSARGFLRLGPLRFRPGQADLLHFELWDGDWPVLIDGGTGHYTPVLPALVGTAGHNTIAFDDTEQMPRLGRFLLARWPAAGPLPEGGWLRDHRGRRHARRIAIRGRVWRVEDVLAGAFATVTLRWRLGPGPWTRTPTGAVSPRARLSLAANAPLEIALEAGCQSPAYGRIEPALVLVARAARPVRRLRTRIALLYPGQ